MYDEYGFYEGQSETAQNQSFFSSALDKVQSFVAPIQDFAQTPAGSQLFSAIYEYGRGKIDAAREKAVGSFLMTSEGQRLQAEATRQTINQHLPMLVIGGAVIVFLILVLFSRK